MELTAIFLAVTLQYQLPGGLLESLCFVESSHRIHVIHYNDGGENSLGVCQIKLSTAKWLGFKGTAKQLMLPKNNIKYAGMYLKKQIARYNSINKGIIAYNRGNAKDLTTTKYLSKVTQHLLQRRANERRTASTVAKSEKPIK